MNTTQATSLSVIIAAVLIGGAFFLSRSSDIPAENGLINVSVVDGKQIIDIEARGGYFPKQTVAKAGLPNVLRVGTQGTFDCSSALVIPAIGYQRNLPYTGTTDIEVPPQKAGTVFQGRCVMGMYSFTINFE